MELTTVYFILEKDLNVVKIGAALRLLERLQQHNNDGNYELLVIIPLVDKQVEFNLHKHFVQDKINSGREWFDYSESIKNFIHNVRIIQTVDFKHITIAKMNEYNNALYKVKCACYPLIKHDESYIHKTGWENIERHIDPEELRKDYDRIMSKR